MKKANDARLLLIDKENPAHQARCLTKDWKFVKRESTDIAKTFARIRAEQAQQSAEVKDLAQQRKKHG